MNGGAWDILQYVLTIFGLYAMGTSLASFLRSPGAKRRLRVAVLDWWRNERTIAVAFVVTFVALVGKYASGLPNTSGYAIEFVNLMCLANLWVYHVIVPAEAEVAAERAVRENDAGKASRWPREVKLVATGSLLLVIVLWLVTWWSLRDDRAGRGTWGDMFGGANALFSGLAFVGIVVAILLQSHELSLQREELATQRRELERQNVTMAQQLFESRFVALLRLLRESVASIQWVDRVSSLSGPAAIERAARRVAHDSRGPRLNPRDIEQGFRCLNPHPISHALTAYFTSCTELLRWLDESPQGDSRRYRDMLVTTFSQAEIWLLLMFAATSEGSTFRPLAVKHGIFDGFQGPKAYHRLIAELQKQSTSNAGERR